LGLEEAKVVSNNSCASSVSINSSCDSLDSEISAKLKKIPSQSIAIQEYLAKSTELRKKLACLASLDEETIQVHRIPKKTTDELQPLDVFCNRQIKKFDRAISSRIRRCHPDFILSKRANIALLLNQTLHQFAAPRFRDFIRYSFFRAGYTQERPPFKTPPQYCLDSYNAGGGCEEGLQGQDDASVCLLREMLVLPTFPPRDAQV
jgi:hypothetical protein